MIYFLEISLVCIQYYILRYYHLFIHLKLLNVFSGVVISVNYMYLIITRKCEIFKAYYSNLCSLYM